MNLEFKVKVNGRDDQEVKEVLKLPHNKIKFVVTCEPQDYKYSIKWYKKKDLTTVISDTDTLTQESLPEGIFKFIVKVTFIYNSRERTIEKEASVRIFSGIR